MKNDLVSTLRHYLVTVDAIQEFYLGDDSCNEKPAKRGRQKISFDADKEKVARQKLMEGLSKIMVNNSRFCKLMLLINAVIFASAIGVGYIFQTVWSGPVGMTAVFAGGMGIMKVLREVWATARLIEFITILTPGLPEEDVLSMIESIYYAELNRRSSLNSKRKKSLSG